MSQIHTAMLQAMTEIAHKGIAKLGRNTDQKYNFRGVEQAMNEMSPILIRAGITITPSYSEYTVTLSESKSGTKLRFVTLKGTFKFEAADGSFVIGEAYGEGMDSSDKATTKAMSVAYRTALFQQFIVPTMSMDPELDGPEETDGEGSELDGYRAAAMQGEKALRAHYEEHKPSAEFWRKHSESLKAAAKQADAETRQ